MIKKQGFIAEGTMCKSCETIIKSQAMNLEGVTGIEFDFKTETGKVVYDDSITDIDKILYKIEEKGYTCYILKENSGAGKKYIKSFGWIAGILGILIIGYFASHLIGGLDLPQIDRNMGYGLLFIVGLLTGIHCVGMCGGFVVSYSSEDAIKGRKSYTSHLMYGAGKIISYTLIGAFFGLFGSIIAFTPLMRGIAGIIAGLFLILYGLKMLNIIPFLRKIQFRLPGKFSGLIDKSRRKNSQPFVIGLLNGLMIACGPLQAIYMMAAGTGSLIEGAKLLFIFALGTLPVMLGFGYITTIISMRLTNKILKVSGIIILLLGLIMINNGLVLTGTGFDYTSLVLAAKGDTGLNDIGPEPLKINQGYQEIRMEVTRSGWTPDTFVLKTGIPVRWIIDGKEITGCNNAIQVPKYGLEFDIHKGEQVIEFTPDGPGVIRWSCWMGMIPGTFIVMDDPEDQTKVQEELESLPKPSAGTCGGSCGSPTCTGASETCGCGG